VTTTSVSELRQNLQAFLARVAAGERIRVTSHGRAIAEIGPPAADESAAAAARDRLRGSVLKFERPTEPAMTEDEWQMLR
jgi:prevent-host-death family protein